MVKKGLKIIAAIIFCLIIFVENASATTEEQNEEIFLEETEEIEMVEDIEMNEELEIIEEEKLLEHEERFEQPYFSDVTVDHYAFTAIQFLHKIGIVQGRNHLNFEPNSQITRAEVAKVIAAERRLVASDSYQLKSKDIPNDYWGLAFIKAVEQGRIMEGFNELFRPNDKISRAEVAAILNRAYSLAKPTQFHHFNDVDKDHWAYLHINLLASNGITKETNYRPNDFLTRAEFALLLARALDDRFKK